MQILSTKDIILIEVVEKNISAHFVKGVWKILPDLKVESFFWRLDFLEKRDRPRTGNR